MPMPMQSSVTYSVAGRLFVDCRGLTREVKSTHPAKVPFECLRMGLSPEQVERNRGRDSWAGALPVGPVFVSRGMMVAW